MIKSSLRQQLGTLLWKNFLLKKRNRNQTIQEIFFPIYFVVLLAMIRMTIKTQPEVSGFRSNDISTASAILQNAEIFISPRSDAVDSFTSQLLQLFPASYNISIQTFDWASAAEEGYVKMPDSSSHYVIGIDFQTADPENLIYTLRFPYEVMPSSHQYGIYGSQGQCRDSNGLSTCPGNSYLLSGFAHLQLAIDTVAVQRLSENPEFPLPQIKVEQMPKAEWQPSFSSMQMLASIYFVLAYSFFIGSLTVQLVWEKEKKLKESMRMMGMRDSAFWLSWFLTYAVLLLLVTMAVTVLAKLIGLIQTGSIPLFFLLLFLYGLSIINLAFLLTPFFTKAEVAGTFASLATMVLSLLYLAVSLTRDEVQTAEGPVSSIPVWGQWLLALFSPVALALGIDQGLFLDIVHGGMTVSNSTVGQFSVCAALIMLALDCVLYGLLAAYFDLVIPGEFGRRRSPLFCLNPAYWRPRGRSSGETTQLLRPPSPRDLPPSVPPGDPPGHPRDSGQDGPPVEDCEPMSQDMQSRNVLRIQSVRKTFKGKDKPVAALDGVSLDLYEGQITALLGHNGAGKTTLINLLTGLTPPSGGTATVYGLDINDANDMSEIRAMTGVCSQHNVLFDKLTCIEHLEIFSALKGIDPGEVQAQVATALAEVDLTDKKSTQAQKLSGGQKRKLSVAISLLGNPKVVVLDEPSAGMDPFSRRQLWMLLKERRRERVILLTTHFMDEADLLADRKAFISRGKLKCVGSSLFLKNRFGVGYHLGLVASPTADHGALTEVVRRHVTGAKLDRVHGSEVTFTLPLASIDGFQALFSQIEEAISNESLGITSYGVSMTTLEEVFLKLGIQEAAADEPAADDAAVAGDPPPRNPALLAGMNITQPPDGANISQQRSILDVDGLHETPAAGRHRRRLAVQQFATLCRVRVLTLWRKKTALFYRLGLPILLLLAGAVFFMYGSTHIPGTEPQPISLEVALYSRAPGASSGNPDVVYSVAYPGDVTSAFIGSIEAQGVGLSPFTDTGVLLEHPPHHMGLEIYDMAAENKTIRCDMTLLYNDTALHSLPATVNLLTNGLMRMVAPPGQAGNASVPITTYSQPWPNVRPTMQGLGQRVFGGTLFFGLALIFLPPLCGVSIVRERQDKTRSQLRISGVSSNIYWGTTMAVDGVQYLILTVAALVITIAFGVTSMTYSGAILSLVVMLLLYMPLSLLLCYVLAFAFKKFDVAQAVMPNVFLILSFVPYVAVSLSDMRDMTFAANLLHYVFVIVDPPYIILGAIYYIDKVYLRSLITQRVNSPTIPIGAYFTWESNIPICLLMAVFHSGLLYLVLRYLEVSATNGDPRDVCCGLCRCGGKARIPLDNPDTCTEEDCDVQRERERVDQLGHTHEDHVVVVKNLRKQFVRHGGALSRVRRRGGQKTVAVRNVTFAVQRGEVFGLLGPNGAGKTTLLNMISAEEGPTRGRITVAGCDVTSSLSEAFNHMGCCPQHDPLWELLTAREHIQYYAAFKGLPKNKIAAVTNFYLKSLAIENYADKPAKFLSGGTKRKLSYAISMLGDPSLVLLDEPSTGMDPKSKRFLWDTISRTFAGSGRGAILTTHYMEEADALCSRLGILVNGQLQCLGSSQHLKNKYGTGYILEVKLSSQEVAATTALHNFVLGIFPGAAETERFWERATYLIPQDQVGPLSDIFGQLQQQKWRLGIEEYSFSQTTLEQVFLEFAKRQRDETDLPDERDDNATSRLLSTSV